jgi:hypothetical protein
MLAAASLAIIASAAASTTASNVSKSRRHTLACYNSSR